MARKTYRLLIALCLTALVVGTSSCTGSANGRRSTPQDEVYQDRDDDSSTYEDGNEDDEVEANPEEEARKQRERTLTQRQREHRRSLQSMGSWFISFLVGIGLNILLAILLWG